ncbi:MAG: TRAP transporter fused permease subunit [Eubacteriales bacterium]|nr:TRAP transporter fused permease subunit [Clostridiales bacterium]MDD7301817.1 TRAP transporter fused permease subunit [Eubacteriales bacterium]MDY4433797.1 TRAP transporter fused permease subunit [Candidatus Flemingibacterium sp.]
MKNDAGTVGSAPEEDIDAVVDAVMKKYDRESNTRVWEGKPKLIVSIVLALFSVFCIYVTLFASWLEEIRLSSFVGLIVLIGYIVFPAKKGVQKVNHMPWYDIVIMIAGTASFFYFTFNAYGIIQQGAKFETYQILIGLVGIAALAELCRRSVGLPILIVAAAFIVYALIWGLVNPTFMGRLNYLVRSLFYSKEGILSTPINTCSKFIVVFIIFGAFLERTGIADFFIQAANAVVGGFSGGPAKVAVVASALEGMVSGSSVANTVGSGSVTIPLMKRTGYKPEFAAAAEASASTGGQIMPPIMGAAAFLMADYVAKPYSEIIVMAILPAILYFTGIFISVHLEAKKLGLRGVPRSELPRFGQLAKKLYLLLPLVILIYLVSSNTKTIQTAAAIAIVAAVIVSLFNKGNRITPKRFLEALAAGGQGTISVAAACGIAGIIAGTITMTGLANVIINGIVALAGDQVIIALFLTMICCIVLGMGVPTTANYCIMAATCAPILVRMGVPLVAAHFFVFYFGIVADLTPPVALAAYAGAAIAQSNPMKTALQSTKLAIAAFIVPYAFALNPVMLFIDVTGPIQVASIIITSLVGIFGVASALEGYIFVKMNPVQRVMAAAGGLLLIDPRVLTDIIGIALVAVVIGWQVFTKKRGTVMKAAA